MFFVIKKYIKINEEEKKICLKNTLKNIRQGGGASHWRVCC